MNRFSILIFCSLFLVSACSEKKNTGEKSPSNSSAADSIKANSDTIGIDSADVAPPVAVDELFADFIYSYSTNRSFQYRRTDFPLKRFNNGKKMTAVNRIDWKFNKMYYNHSLHLLILDNEKTFDKISTLKTDTVKLERLLFKQKKCVQYVFEREKGIWRLNRMNYISLAKHADSGFLTFYDKFASDSAFQSKHLNSTIDFVTYDEDNSFQKIEGLIDESQWAAFRPELPAGDIFCVNYNIPLKNHNVRVVSVRGNSNGMFSMFKFRRIRGTWKLVKFEN